MLCAPSDPTFLSLALRIRKAGMWLCWGVGSRGHQGMGHWSHMSKEFLDPAMDAPDIPLPWDTWNWSSWGMFPVIYLLWSLVRSTWHSPAEGQLCVGSSGFPNLALQGLEFPIFPREIHFLGHFLIVWGLHGAFLPVSLAFLVELPHQLLREVQNHGESLWMRCSPGIYCCI